MSEDKKPWGFCETPEAKCTMNYCDENGCQNRKRTYAPLKSESEDISARAEEYVRKYKPVVSSSADTGGIDKYFEDLDKWENSFYCNECGCDKITDFAYDRTVANGEVWHCKHCKTETVTGNKPNEDRY